MPGQAADGRLQETTLDMGHAGCPNMELVEGNWAAQIGEPDGVGALGLDDALPNYASSPQYSAAAANETYQIAATPSRPSRAT